MLLKVFKTQAGRRAKSCIFNCISKSLSLFQFRRFIDLHDDGFGQHLFRISSASNTTIRPIQPINLKLPLDLSGLFAAAIISRAESPT
jgi:hypothetical protein